MSGKGVVSSLWKCYDCSKVGMSMVLVQLFATGMMILSRIILGNGTFVFALMTYRHVIAAVCVAPLALILERGQRKDNKLTLQIWVWLFINGLIGITGAMGLYYYGLMYTTATYAVNFLNLIPIVTFVISVIVGMESLGLHRWSDRFKVMGAVVCVGGSLTTSLYSGKEFYIHHVALHHSSQHVVQSMKSLVKGSIMLTGSCLCYAVWFIVQAKLLKMFPLKYWVTMLSCVMATLQSIVIGVSINRRKAAWKLGFDLPLVTIVYSGALSTAATFCLISYAVKNRGPTYPPMFSPLTLIFISLLEALILGEPIRLGTLLGTILIIVGLYAYLWGKQNESKTRMNGENQASQNIQIAIVDPILSLTIDSGNVDHDTDTRNVVE